MTSSDGDGLSVVINQRSGSGTGDEIAETVRGQLPAAKVIEVTEDDDIAMALTDAAAGAHVLGIAGGDGSVEAAAAVALDRGLPLFVVPGGTLNHFARDAGLGSVDDSIAALRTGHAVAIDVGEIAGGPFVNTASFGAYTDLVDMREQLEPRIGKWPALLVALALVLRRSSPVRVELDGVEHTLWLAFVGNCEYQPLGFAPSWRARLDDGLLDVRVIDGADPWARTRAVLAVLTGRLARCRSYKAWTAQSLDVHSPDGPLRLATDGETFDGPERFSITKGHDRLAVYVPPPS